MTDEDFPPVHLTIDCVLLTLADGAPGLSVALHKRLNVPFRALAALPGGYIHAETDADLDAAARRILATKLGLSTEGIFLEQLCTVSGATRDPRGWTASVVHYALVPASELPEPGRRFFLAPVDDLPDLAFDHREIVAMAVERVRSKTGYSNLPGFLLPERFTMPELIDVYERVLGLSLDQSVFRRRMDELGLIEAIPDAFRTGGRHRPAQLYRLAQHKASMHDRIVVQKPRARAST